MQELWKDIEGYAGLYMISNYGRVKNAERLLKPSLSTNGYYKVRLRSNGKKKDYRVHRLVAMAFVPNCESKPFINHKDGNRLNNRADNLEWCTQKENVLHALEMGLKEKVCVAEKVLRRLYVEEKKSAPEIAEILGTTPAIIRNRMREYGIKGRQPKEQTRKYNIPLWDLLEAFKRNERNVDLAKKYNCTTGLIAVRKHQFRERGLL